ncbi:hypothetical protein L5515_018812 [Caenorhabditis briggsae]|uniref:Uncharacterized protein n=1 Tax=Caenorhabditis briggsae TaxID=6238 RepID=A0AAE9FK67_CAEBR|nr:hypothetical protein L5515_018812 [Caenorhabditis briggsae]
MLLLEVVFLFILLPMVSSEKVKRQEQHVTHEIPKFKRGPIVIVDETALTNPNSFDYDFSDDLDKPADKQDLYDQFIDQLPMFHIYKLGTDRGVTQVPIVTRAGDTWFTPSTISNREQKFTFYLTTPMTPKKATTTIAPTTTRKKSTTTPMPTTENTTTPSTTTNAATTTTITAPTSTSIFRHRRPFPKQPAPVFRPRTSSSTTTTTTAPETPVINRGPIWRKGGVVIDTTTTPRPLTTPRQWTVRGFRVGARRTSTVTTTTTEAPTTTTRRTTTQAPTTSVPWWKTTTTASSRWVAGPRHPPRFNQNQNWKQPIRKLQETVGRTVALAHVDPINRSQPKPVVIHTGRYAGPTYNCRVLNPFTDGQQSAEHDSSCKMLYPGLSLDGSCRCFYKVAGRDEHGCATGFIYACRALGLRSISV